MLTRDFLVRQVHQLAQILAVVVAGKRAGQAEEAQRALADGLSDALGLTLADLRTLARADLQALCAFDGAFAPEKALAVADLLREDEAEAGRRRALWLYEAALDAGDLVPFDIYDRIAELRTSLER